MTSLTMSEHERLDLSREAGRDLSIEQAHEFRIRKIHSEAVALMLRPRVRTINERRLVNDRRGIKPEHMLYVDVCCAAKCRFVGVQRGFPEHGLEPMVIFLDDIGSSLALPMSRFNLESVRARLAESNAKWEQAGVRTEVA